MDDKSTIKYYKDEDLLTQIGLKIRFERTKENILQESLANECGIDYSQVNRMELGKVNFSKSYLFRIGAALEIDAKSLLP